MKAFLISDNTDTLVGMKIAGIKGVVLHDREDILNYIEDLKKQKDVNLIILTEKIAMLITEEVKQMKLSKSGPLIVDIPDRHGTMKGEDSILRYVKEAIGLKL